MPSESKPVIAEHRHLETGEDLRTAVVDLLASARREVLLFAPRLDPIPFNLAEVTENIGHVIARRPGNRLRIVVEDTEHLLIADVRLVEMTRRFSDLILIRRLGETHRGLAKMFLVADEKSCLHMPDFTRMDASYDLHAPHLAAPLAQLFETIWAASEPIAGLHPFRV